MALCALLITALAWPARPAFARQAPDETIAAQPPTAAATLGGSDSSAAGPLPAGDPAAAGPKNDRIFMVIPNYTTVEGPEKFAPITVKEKFKLGAEDAFDPYSFLLAGIVAGIAQARDDDASWGQGLRGYGLRYAAGVADTTIGSFMTTGVFPSLLREDPRYFRKGSGGFWRRGGYAIKRLFVARSDSGRSEFNFSEFGGNAVAGGISLAYHSREERHFANFASDWGTQITIDFVANQLKEFWPDIRHKLSRL